MAPATHTVFRSLHDRSPWHELVNQVDGILRSGASAPVRTPHGHCATLLGALMLLHVNPIARRVTIESTVAPFGTGRQPDVGAPLSNWDWLDELLASRLRALVEEVAAEQAQSDRWVARCVRNTVRANRALVASARAQIRAALAVPQPLMVLAHRARLDFARIGFDAGHLTRVWQWQSALERVQRESPSLVRIVMAAIEANVVDDPGPGLVAHVKRHMRMSFGWSERFWRLLHNSAGFFEVPLALRRASPALKVIGNYGATLDAACVNSPPHPLVAAALIRSQRDPLMALLPFAEDWYHGDPALLGLALRQATHERGDLDRFLREQFHAFLRWSTGLEQPVDLSRTRNGWARVMRMVQAHEDAIRAGADQSSWRSLVPSFRAGAFEVHPLTTSKDLFDEGTAMRNCLAVRLDHIARCLDDLERVFSIRHCGRRVATVSLFRPALLLDFDVEEVRGKANCAVSEAIVALADDVCRRYNMATRRAVGGRHAMARPSWLPRGR